MIDRFAEFEKIVGSRDFTTSQYRLVGHLSQVSERIPFENLYCTYSLEFDLLVYVRLEFLLELLKTNLKKEKV